MKLQIGMGASAVLLCGCMLMVPKAAPPSAAAKAFADHRAWMLKEDMVYRIGETNKAITVPKGFVTDYASVPKVIWSVFSPHDHYSRAAVVHDYLYWSQVCTKSQADNLLMLAMIESNVSWWKRTSVHLAVKQFGKSSWDENIKQKAAGYIRLVVNERKPESNETWDAYRESLLKRGVTEPPLDVPTDVCILGDDDRLPNPDR